MTRTIGTALAILGASLSVSSTAVAARPVHPAHKARQVRVVHVSGQQTTITLSASATGFLAAHNVTAAPVGAASASGDAWTFPIARGFVVLPADDGRLVHRGGVRLSSGGRSIALRRLVLRRVGHRAALTARLRGHRIPIAHVSGFTVSRTGKTATVTGELRLSKRAAHWINRRLGKHAVSAGADLGSLKSIVTIR